MKIIEFIGTPGAGKTMLMPVVIDYLQLLEPDNSKDPRQEQVAKIALGVDGDHGNAVERRFLQQR